MRIKSQSGIWHLQHLLRTRDGNVRGGGHAWPQAEVGIFHSEFHIVGHDIVVDHRAVCHPLHRRLVGAHRPGIDREICLLPGRDATDVRLGHRHDQIHFSKVFGDHKKNRRGEGCRHRLTHLDRTRQHDAIDRRADDAFGEIALDRAEVCLRFIHRRLGTLELRFRAIDRRLRGIELRL